MKKIFETFKRLPILFVLLIVLVFFMPTNLAKPIESVRNAIITSIGLDYEEGEYELTLLSFIPTPGKGFVETYNINSVKGESLSQAMIMAGRHLGKDVTLFHTETAILGDGILKLDVSKVLDYFSREESLSNSCVLIGINEKAKDMLKFMQEEDINPSEKLRELMLFNSEKVNCKKSSVETFYRGFYSPVKSSVMPYLFMEEKNDDTGIMLNKSKGTGSESSSSAEEKSSQKEIKNDGSVALFFKGRMVKVLSGDQADNMNWVNCDNTIKSVKIENLTDDELTNATANYLIKKKEVVKSPRFENGTPVITYFIKLFVDRNEVYADRSELNKSIQINNINELVSKKIEQKVKEQFARALTILRQEKTDIIGVYRDFYEKRRSEFKKYLENLEDSEDFMKNIIFEVKVKVVAD